MKRDQGARGIQRAEALRSSGTKRRIISEPGPQAPTGQVGQGARGKWFSALLLLFTIHCLPFTASAAELNVIYLDQSPAYIPFIVQATKAAGDKIDPTADALIIYEESGADAIFDSTTIVGSPFDPAKVNVKTGLWGVLVPKSSLTAGRWYIALWEMTVDAVTTAKVERYFVLNHGTAQTGDSFARLGAPAGASVSADVAAVKLDTAAILDDTGTSGVVVAAGSKAGYSLTQSFPTNFSALAITAGGAVTVGTNNDKTGYTASTVSDKTGYSLTVSPPTSATIADAVWDEVLSGHLVAGSTGNALNAAGSAGDPWSTVLPGAYGAGTAGKIIGDNINATISSRLASAGYTAPDNASVTAIKATTDKLDTSMELDVAVYRFTANALEQAPSGGGSLTAQQIWDYNISAYTGAGLAGTYLKGAGAAGDPWVAALPGAYGAGTAGFIIGGISSGVTVNPAQITAGVLSTTVKVGAPVVWRRGDADRMTIGVGATCAKSGARYFLAVKADPKADNATAIINREITITDPATVTGYIDLTSSETAIKGNYYAEIERRDADGTSSPRTCWQASFRIDQDVRQ